MYLNNFVFSFTLTLTISIGLVSSDGENSGGGLTVVVSYEALNPCSLEFFKSQLTDKVFEDLSQCNIDWKIIPCSTSKMVMEKLTCWQGEPECEADRIYACATKLNEGNMKAVGKFAICLMNAGSAKCSAQNCASDAGMKWEKIEACSKTPQADKNCNEYWGKANDDWQMVQLPGVMVPPKYVESDGEAAKKDFKGFVCKKMKEKNISCPACGGCSGGGEHVGHPLDATPSASTASPTPESMMSPPPNDPPSPPSPPGGEEPGIPP